MEIVERGVNLCGRERFFDTATSRDVGTKTPAVPRETTGRPDKDGLTAEPRVWV